MLRHICNCSSRASSRRRFSARERWMLQVLHHANAWSRQSDKHRRAAPLCRPAPTLRPTASICVSQLLRAVINATPWQIEACERNTAEGNSQKTNKANMCIGGPMAGSQFDVKEGNGTMLVNTNTWHDLTAQKRGGHEESGHPARCDDLCGGRGHSFPSLNFLQARLIPLLWHLIFRTVQKRGSGTSLTRGCSAGLQLGFGIASLQASCLKAQRPGLHIFTEIF